MGLSECDNMLLLLGVCREMEKEEQKIVTRKMIEGFHGMSLCCSIGNRKNLTYLDNK
jgi:hypothetical protein